MLAIVVAGSSLDGPLDPSELRSADLLIAADSGAEAVLRAGCLPHLLVGDMDSIVASAAEDLQARGVETLLLPVAKDETDLEMALRLAIERGARTIVVHGALGGPRLDHLVATLLLLTAPWLAGADVRLVDPEHDVALAGGDRPIAGRPGDVVSLLPLTPRVEDVASEGLLYPLKREPLLQGTTRGVSNELTGERARVTHGAGDLLVIHYRAKPEPHDHPRDGAHERRRRLT